MCVFVNFPLNKRIYFSIKNQKGQHDLSSKSPGKKRRSRKEIGKCPNALQEKDHTIMHDLGGSQICFFFIIHKYVS